MCNLLIIETALVIPIKFLAQSDLSKVLSVQRNVFAEGSILTDELPQIDAKGHQSAHELLGFYSSY